MTFEWDERKNAENLQKHHIAFEDAQRAFLDRKRLIIEDTGHSDDEQRLFCLGMVDGEVVTVRFTMRARTIRIIGAGYWRKGKRRYEEENHIH